MESHRHHKWFDSVHAEIANDYNRLHGDLSGPGRKKDIQRAGHGGESTWKRAIERWLPPGYEMASRKYVLPEHGSDEDAFETDLVVFNPAYPSALREREEVLAGGIAAAFSVKLTLDAEGIRDAVNQAVRLRRALKPRYGTPRDEMLPPFFFGLLAHSHEWKKPNSQALDNIKRILVQEDMKQATHPRELLDLVCVADTGTWTTYRMPYFPPDIARLQQVEAIYQSEGFASTAIMGGGEEDLLPFAVFIAQLTSRLAIFNPLIAHLDDAFRLTNLQGSGSGLMRRWRLSDVYSESVNLVMSGEKVWPSDDRWTRSFY